MTCCPRCDADYWEYVEDDVIECVFCGVRKRTSRRRAAPKALVFETGRFAGMTIEQAAAAENGREYLEFVRGSNPRVDQYLRSLGR